MTTPPAPLPVRLVQGSQASSATAQTKGMVRESGVDAKTVGAHKVWMGLVVFGPSMRSAAHHHGEAETAVYVISGRLRIHFGEGYTQSVEASPGDYLYIPAFTPHIEENTETEPVKVIASRSPDNIVVNLE
jgi:uncharacterized RmlC-like cupin family protein